jgi:biotin synthase
LPFIELLYRAATVHRMFFNPREVQQCTLISIKTGGCTEDCKYCSQVGLQGEAPLQYDCWR